MPDLLERPVFERGTTPERHPYFLLDNGNLPPILPPGCNIVRFAGEPPQDDKDKCPGCGSVKALVCQCGYDWDNDEWVTREGRR